MEITVNPELTVRKIDEDTFVFNRKDSRIHSFNRSGAFLWDVVQKASSTSVVLGSFIDKYDIDRETAEADLREFLGNLAAAGLVEIR
jgi:Coenzyme PQQ synthesis protein D (PqqD)